MDAVPGCRPSVLARSCRASGRQPSTCASVVRDAKTRRIVSGFFTVGALVLSFRLVSNVRDFLAQHSLDHHSVETSATVEHASFDEDGGDPGGWTSLVVLYSTSDGPEPARRRGPPGPG